MEPNKTAEVVTNVESARSATKNKKPIKKVKTNDKKPTDKSTALQHCFNYFGPKRECKFNDKCKYSHDETLYLTEHNLQKCSTSDCKNFCKNDYCRTCNTEYYKAEYEARQAKKALYEQNAEPKQCSGYQCTEYFTTRGKFCKECEAVNMSYNLDYRFRN
jgi:hypothetical protein